MGLALAACAGALLAPVAAEARMPAPRIKVLSNRADLVSGGDVLVRVTLLPEAPVLREVFARIERVLARRAAAGTQRASAVA